MFLAVSLAGGSAYCGQQSAFCGTGSSSADPCKRGGDRFLLADGGGFSVSDYGRIFVSLCDWKHIGRVCV